MLTACEQYVPLSPVSRWRRASPPHSCAPREWCRRRTPRSARSRRRRGCSSPEHLSLCRRRAPRPRTSQAICYRVVVLSYWRTGPADEHRESPVALRFLPAAHHTHRVESLTMRGSRGNNLSIHRISYVLSTSTSLSLPPRRGARPARGPAGARVAPRPARCDRAPRTGVSGVSRAGPPSDAVRPVMAVYIGCV